MKALGKTKTREVASSRQLAEKVGKLMMAKGQAGMVAKVGLLAGMRKEEILYCFAQPVCPNVIGCCSCHGLHIYNDRRGITVVEINWTRARGKRRIYLALFPSKLWESFRGMACVAESDLEAADKASSQAACIPLRRLRHLHFQVLSKSLSTEQMDVLMGKARPEDAQHMVQYGLGSLISNYCHSWTRVGVILIAF
jgi:hypothetical protein